MTHGPRQTPSDSSMQVRAPGSWKHRHPTRYDLARSMLEREVPHDRVIASIMTPELSEADARAIVEEAWRDARPDRIAEGRELIRQAWPALFSGLVGIALILKGRSWQAEAGGAALLIYGIADFVNGWRKMRS